jgi:DNA replication protein DnaC
VYFGRSYCGCGPKLRAAERALERADAAGAMTSSSLAADSDPSVLHAASVLREIAYGNPSDGRGPRKRGVFMFGLPGRGKTHLSVATAREVLAGGRLVGLYSLAELVSRVQDTYGYSDGAETKTRIIEEVCSHDVVVLDDFGKEHRSPDTESIVYMLVDGLYRARRTLVASSNLPGRDFVERYDGAVLSRLGGMCEKLVIRGEDRRAREWEW